VGNGSRWHVFSGDFDAAAARAVLSDDTAWRLLFNGLAPDAISASVLTHGNVELLRPFFAARSVVV
jgi:predicted amidohydrolase